MTMSRAYRKNTLKNLRSQALIYHRFCVYHNLSMFPATEWQMVRFARYLGNSVTSVETVKNYLAGVRTLHRVGGFRVPDPSEPNLNLLLRGLKFELAHATKQARPMTPRILYMIYQQLRLEDKLELISFAALVLGFYLFLRPSNLVPTTEADFLPGEQLTKGDVRRQGAYTMVDIRWSKTVQYKQKINSLPLIPSEKIEICPVFWTNVVKSINNRGKDDPLFSFLQGKRPVVVTYSQLSRRLKEWMVRIGRDPEGYTLHGLRRGGCSWGLQAGLVGQQIQLMGDWATLAYFRYLDTTMEQKIHSMVRFVDEVNVASKAF